MSICYFSCGLIFVNVGSKVPCFDDLWLQLICKNHWPMAVMEEVNVTSLQTKNLGNRDDIFLLVLVFDDMMTKIIMLFPIYVEGGKYQLRGSVYMILLSPRSTTPFHLQNNKFAINSPHFFLPC